MAWEPAADPSVFATERASGTQQMSGKPLFAVLALSALALGTVGIGLGYGLAAYTVSGIDPFYATARGPQWQADTIGTKRTATADRTKTIIGEID